VGHSNLTYLTYFWPAASFVTVSVGGGSGVSVSCSASLGVPRVLWLCASDLLAVVGVLQERTSLRSPSISPKVGGQLKLSLV
jgi:hypothetical protein